MLLQLSHFPPPHSTPSCPPHPSHIIPYNSCPWVIHMSSLSSTFPTLFLTSPLSSFYLSFMLLTLPSPSLSPSHSPVDNPPCDPPKFNQFCEHPDVHSSKTSGLNCASGRLAISLSLSCVFFWSFDLFFHLGHLFLSWRACYVKGRSLRCSPGRGNTSRSVVARYVGEGSDREQWRLLHSLPVFSHSPHYPQSNWAPLVLLPRWVVLCTL